MAGKKRTVRRNSVPISLPKKWLTTSELCQYLGFGSDEQQRQWRDEGIFPHYVMGRTILYKVTEVDDAVEKGKIDIKALCRFRSL